MNMMISYEEIMTYEWMCGGDFARQLFLLVACMQGWPEHNGTKTALMKIVPVSPIHSCFWWSREAWTHMKLISLLVWMAKFSPLWKYHRMIRSSPAKCFGVSWFFICPFTVKLNTKNGALGRLSLADRDLFLNPNLHPICWYRSSAVKRNEDGGVGGIGLHGSSPSLELAVLGFG